MRMSTRTSEPLWALFEFHRPHWFCSADDDDDGGGGGGRDDDGGSSRDDGGKTDDGGTTDDGGKAPDGGTDAGGGKAPDDGGTDGKAPDGGADAGKQPDGGGGGGGGGPDDGGATFGGDARDTSGYGGGGATTDTGGGPDGSASFGGDARDTQSYGGGSDAVAGGISGDGQLGGAFGGDVRDPSNYGSSTGTSGTTDLSGAGFGSPGAPGSAPGVSDIGGELSAQDILAGNTPISAALSAAGGSPTIGPEDFFSPELAPPGAFNPNAPLGEGTNNPFWAPGQGAGTVDPTAPGPLDPSVPGWDMMGPMTTQPPSAGFGPNTQAPGNYNPTPDSFGMPGVGPFGIPGEGPNQLPVTPQDRYAQETQVASADPNAAFQMAANAFAPGEEINGIQVTPTPYSSGPSALPDLFGSTSPINPQAGTNMANTPLNDLLFDQSDLNQILQRAGTPTTDPAAFGFNPDVVQQQDIAAGTTNPLGNAVAPAGVGGVTMDESTPAPVMSAEGLPSWVGSVPVASAPAGVAGAGPLNGPTVGSAVQAGLGGPDGQVATTPAAQVAGPPTSNEAPMPLGQKADQLAVAGQPTANQVVAQGAAAGMFNAPAVSSPTPAGTTPAGQQSAGAPTPAAPAAPPGPADSGAPTVSAPPAEPSPQTGPDVTAALTGSTGTLDGALGADGGGAPDVTGGGGGGGGGGTAGIASLLTPIPTTGDGTGNPPPLDGAAEQLPQDIAAYFNPEEGLYGIGPGGQLPTLFGMPQGGGAAAGGVPSSQVAGLPLDVPFSGVDGNAGTPVDVQQALNNAG